MMDIDERIGAFIFAMGGISLIVGLLFLSRLGSIVSACCIFFGITFTAFGLLIRLEFFHGNLLSLNGLGTLLISLSIIFFALSLSLMQFVRLDIRDVIPLIFRGTVIGYKLAAEYERIYVPTCSFFLKLWLFSLIAGLLIKIYNAIKS
jgi:hypothetical protein